jgi:serine/threonine-protein kinase HipA
MEYRYYEAALAAGAEIAPSRLVVTKAGKFFMTRRFDRTDGGGRIHMASAAGLLHADFRIPGDEYALLFRLTDALTHDQSAKAELFRRACLNVVAHNRDDHLKNFSFLMDEKGRWSLAPFYDFTYAEGPNGWQTLSVSGEGANPGVDDLRRLAKDVGLEKSESEPIIERVVETCRSLVVGGGRQDDHNNKGEQCWLYL